MTRYEQNMSIQNLIAAASSARNTPWNPLSRVQAISLLTGFTLLIYLLAAHDVTATDNESRILGILHMVNLVFHEAGHVIFGFLGRTIHILGGTLGQLLIPLIVAIHFWLQRDPAGFAVGQFWLYENFIDVAAYMADARALKLQLLGGMGQESHDWRNLFMQWGLLQKDTVLAGLVNTLGWMGMIATCLWVAWRAFPVKNQKTRRNT